MKVKTKKTIRAISFVLAVGIMLFIFTMSAQDATESSATSGSIIRLIAPILNWNFGNLSEAGQAEFISSLQHIVRKFAHFSIYTALGFFLSTGMFTFSKLKIYSRVAVGFLIGAVYAVTDEIHQSFIPGRSCELRDVLIDSGGVMLGVAIIFLIYNIYKQRKKTCR